jgi:hypothetical protein
LSQNAKVGASLRRRSRTKVLSGAAAAMGILAAVVALLQFCGIAELGDLWPCPGRPLAGIVVNIRYVPAMEYLAREAERRLRGAGARVDQSLEREMLSGTWVAYATEEQRDDAIRVTEALHDLGPKVQLLGEATDRYATGSADESCVLVLGN